MEFWFRKDSLLREKAVADVERSLDRLGIYLPREEATIGEQIAVRTLISRTLSKGNWTVQSIRRIIGLIRHFQRNSVAIEATVNISGDLLNLKLTSPQGSMQNILITKYTVDESKAISDLHKALSLLGIPPIEG